MEQSWVPAGVTRFVATVAIRDDHACQRFVRNVIRHRTVGRWIGASVTGAALVSDNRLSVVPLARRPACHVVAGAARGRCGNVGAAFARGRTAIVATRAIGRGRERAVINFGTSPVRRRLMAGLTAPGHGCMDGCGRFAGQSGQRLYAA